MAGLTTLNGAVLSGDASITTHAVVPGSDLILIDDEVMLTAPGAPSLTPAVTRGYKGTTAAGHADATQVYEVENVLQDAAGITFYYFDSGVLKVRTLTSASGGSQPVFALIEVGGDFANFGASAIVPCVPASAGQTFMVGTAVCGPVTLTAGQEVSWEAFAPNFSAGSIGMALLEFDVSNALGTEKLALQLSPGSPIALTTGENYSPNLSTWTVVESVGVDLAVDGVTKFVKSTAGGQFFCVATLGLICAGVKP